MSIDIRPNPATSGAVTGGLVYKGSYNATTNSPDLTTSTKGDFYIVSVGGTLAGITLNVGDHIVFNQDAASPITSAMFDVIDNTDAVASVNGATGVVVLDTDDISEGSSNLYYTNARFDTQLATKDTDDISEGSSNLYYTNARFDTQLATKDTDDVSEGSSNLYYTNARFDTQLATKTTDNLTEGSSNLYYTNARFDTQLATKDTGDISEGSNLYYTNARADARIAAANMTDLNDVNYTAGAGIDGQFLKYVNANSRWEAASAPASSDTLDDVVGRGATTATAIQTGGLTVTGDIDPNADVTYNIGDETARFISYYGDMNGAIRFKAKNDSGGVLNKGEAVYIKGLNGTVPTVDKAQANSSATMQSFGLVYANANDQAEVQIVTFGNLVDLDTSSYTLGDTLFISATTGGQLVSSAPAGESNLIQNIGKVLKVHASAGIIKVGGAGRTNATPNLNQDKIFLGNASNQAVSTALSSVNLSSFNNNLDTDDISEGSSNLYYTNARFDTQLGTKTTDNLTEGSSNLYYTNARFDTQLATKTTDNLTEGSSNLYYTNARFDTQLATKDTGDLTEGSNLYYTNARADARIAAANLTDLNDVNYTAGAGIDGYILEYVHANNRWEAKAASGGGGGSRPTVASITTDTTISNPAGTVLELVYLVSGTTSTVTLPTAAGNEGLKIQVKNMLSSAVTVDTQLSQTIDTASSVSLTSQFESFTFISDDTNWVII